MEDTTHAYEMATCDQNALEYQQRRETYTTIQLSSQQKPSEYQEPQNIEKQHQKLAGIDSGRDFISDLSVSEVENASSNTLNKTRKYVTTSMILLTFVLFIISSVAIALAVFSYSRSISPKEDSNSALNEIRNELSQLSAMTENNVSHIINQLVSAANYTLETTNDIDNSSSQLKLVSHSVDNISQVLNQLLHTTQNGMLQVISNINMLGSQVNHLASVTRNNITRIQNQINSLSSNYATVRSTVADIQDDISLIQGQFISSSRAEEIHNNIRRQINTTIQDRLRSPINLYQGCYDIETSCSLQPWLSYLSQPLFCNTTEYLITRTVSSYNDS